MRPTRRRNHLRSSQRVAERWRPSVALVALAAGLLVGLALGLRARASDRSASFQQHYLLLVSDLYVRGAPLASLRERLLSVGDTQPTMAVLDAADQLAGSPDAVHQQEAEQLRQFAQALAAGSASPPTATASSAVQDGARETAPAPTPSVAVTPIGAPLSTSTATPLPSPTLLPTATAPAASPTTAPAKPGVVSTAGGAPAVLRVGPSSTTAAVATLPSGAKISVYGRRQGQALEPPEATWYHVVYAGKQGYLYAKQVKVGS